MKYIRYISLINCLLWALSLCFKAKGQNTFTFPLNVANGLPSNHVFDMMVDRYGYLWICTDKGVCRYNGYELKTFGLADGLPTEEVWELFEDQKGRVWLGANTEELGYIRNSRYHKAILNNIRTEILPQSMRSYTDGIVFFSPFLNKTLRPTFCIEYNDTITALEIPDTLYQTVYGYLPIHKRPYEIPFINYKGKAGFLYDDHLYTINYDKKSISYSKTYKIADRDFYLRQFSLRSVSINKYVLFFDAIQKNDTFSYINSETGIVKYVGISQIVGREKIQHIYVDKMDKLQNRFYLITDDHILQFSAADTIQCEKSISVSNINSGWKFDGKELKTFYPSRRWGHYWGTTTNGAFTRTNYLNEFKKLPDRVLSDFKFIGGREDLRCFWRDKSKPILATVDSQFHITYYTYTNISKIDKMIPVNYDTFLAVGISLRGTHLYIANRGVFTKSPIHSSWRSVASVAGNLRSNFYMIDTRYFNDFVPSEDGPKWNKGEPGKYVDLIYDSLRDKYWAYNTFKISIHSSKGDSIIDKADLSHFGISRLDKILIENKFGNVIIKGSNLDETSVIAYNISDGTRKKLFENYNFSDASIYVYHGLLIVVGRFGVLFSKVDGLLQFSKPIVYENIKDINYQRILDAQVSWNKILLSTDKGCYSVDVPGYAAFDSAVGEI